MTDPNELIRAFTNMKHYTQDHLILTMRPELREGVLEAILIFEKEILRLKSERAELENKLGMSRKPSFQADNQEGSLENIAALDWRSVKNRNSMDAKNEDDEKTQDAILSYWMIIREAQKALNKITENSVIAKTSLPMKFRLQRPTGPIDIGRPYPVYIICYVCNKRVLTATTEKRSGGCCISCLTETPPTTVLHSCPMCHTFLGIYYDGQDDD